VTDSRVEALARWCTGVREPAVFSQGLFDRLAPVVPYEGAFLAAVDPSTLLYTRAFRRGMPAEASAAFVAAELGDDDVNQLRQLVHTASAVGWLDETTRGDRRAARRYRDAMEPYGLGDELRVALMAAGTCWGLLCLHRAQGPTGFTAREASLMRRLAPSMAICLRRSLLYERSRTVDAWDGPGVILLEADGTVRTSTAAGRYWLEQLAELDRPAAQHLPTVVAVVIERLRSGVELGVPARARTLTRSGRWLTVHAASFDDQAECVAVIVEPTSPSELAPLLVAAYGLTSRESEVAKGLLIGDSRKAIASALQLSVFTVHDHIKAVYDKTGASSAGQLRMKLFGQ
jgi:DNA-binding CsgD family transcriptional regulator